MMAWPWERDDTYTDWLPPLYGHERDRYSLTAILSEESAEFNPLLSSHDQFTLKTIVSVKFKSDDIGNGRTLDGLCCAGWDDFEFESYTLNSPDYFAMLARRSMYPFLFIPFEMNREGLTEKVRQFAVKLRGNTHPCYNALCFKLEIIQEVTIPDRVFRSWISWYDEKARADDNFEKDYRRAISRERSLKDTEDFPGGGPVVESCIDELMKRVSLDDSCSESCSICMEGLLSSGSESAVLGLPCAHTFHQECILEWLKVSDKCPLCRFELHPE